MKRELPPIESERLRLRPLREADLEMTRAWRNRDDVRTWFFRTDPVSAEQHRSWFSSYLDKDDDFVFVSEHLGELGPIGQIAVYHIDEAARVAEVGRLLVGEPRARKLGLGRESMWLLTRAAFVFWRLDTVFADIKLDNVASRQALIACGFVEDPPVGDVVRTVLSRRDAAADSAGVLRFARTVSP